MNNLLPNRFMLLLLIFVVIPVLVSTPVHAQVLSTTYGMGQKFARGVTNTFFGVVDVPKTMYYDVQDDGYASGLTLGFVRGLGFGAARTGTGIYDTLTFPIPFPGGYQPIMKPAYVLEPGRSYIPGVLGEPPSETGPAIAKQPSGSSNEPLVTTSPSGSSTSSRNNDQLVVSQSTQNPRRARQLLQQALSQYRSGNVNRSLKTLQQAAQLDSSNADIQFNLGSLHYEQGNYARAITHYQNTLSLSSNDPDAHYYLGRAYQNQGNFYQAERHYRRTLKLQPGHSGARRYLRQVSPSGTSS